MPGPPLNARDPAHDTPGKRNVTYPYGDLRFPRIKEQWTRNKGSAANSGAFLKPYRDRQAFPACLLIAQDSRPGDADTETVTYTYETLPGPIFVEVTPYRDTGIPMLVSKQQVAATAQYTTGEFQPGPVNVAAVVDNGDGTCTVTLSAPHDLPPKCWVVFAGTNSTPAVDGNAQLISVPAATQVTIAGALSGAGTAAGTMQAVNRITRDLKPVASNANLLLKIDTMVGVASTTPAAPLTVSAIAAASATTTTVTLSSAHGLVAGQWVTFTGTDSTPDIDGPAKIVSVPGSTQVVIQAAVTASGTTGAMVYLGDLATFNEDVKCWKDYEFPDALLGIRFYTDGATTTTVGVQPFNSSISWGGAAGLPMQDGYHGPCRARRLRCFFVGPPPDSFEEGFAPTFIMPSSGTFVIAGGSKAINYSPDLSSETISNSNSYRTGRIPHCLTGSVMSGGGGLVGNETGTLAVDLPPSTPTQFKLGDVITLMGQPTKHDAGALWEVIVWLITVPYTSGLAPDGFTYATNPAIYPRGTPISSNAPVISGSPSTFAVTPGLPTGLALNSSTGAITGTPSATTERFIYTVTCLVGGVTQTAYLDLTVT